MARTFTVGAVCEAAGIKTTTLNTWRARKAVEIAKASKLGWTRYSEVDALHVALLAALVRQGVDFRLAAAITNGLREFKQLARVVDGQSLFVAALNVDLNIDDPRRPDGPTHSTFYDPSLARVLKATKKATAKDRSVWVVVDVSKIWRGALSSLDRADT